MKIKFDTDEQSPSEALALIAMLRSLHALPELIIPEIELSETNRPVVAATASKPEPTAAEAFGDDPAPTAAEVFNNPVSAAPKIVGEVDSTGCPWDARIHSGTKGTNKDGSWSRKRNTPDELFEAVRAEIMGGAPAATTPPAPPAPPAATGAPDFPTIMLAVTKAQTAGKLTADKVKEYLASVGLNSVPQLSQATPEIRESFYAMIAPHVA